MSAPAQPLRILLGHLAWSEEALRWHRALAERARAFGVEVETLCLVPDPPAPRLNFDELDRRWRRRDPSLVRIRDQLVEAARGADVFWNFNGANVHPAWLADLATLKVYGCFDDPESTAQLSAPVARYFDAALVGNLSCLPLYRSWGLRRLAWAPMAFLGEEYDPALTPEAVLSKERPIDVVFFGERELPWRRERLDRLAKEFPNAVFHGRGWATGFASAAERRRCYRSAKIGWNLHNSVGPVNLRTFALPAAGVLQISDNKCRLGEVFQLGEEAVGFDSIAGSMDECIELTRYYLEHDGERRRIAAQGLARFARDYAEAPLWDYYQRHLAEWAEALRQGGSAAPRWEPTPRASAIRRVARRAAERAFARIGFEPTRARGTDPGAAASRVAASRTPYCEREIGASNVSDELPRAESGARIERPDIVALGWAVTSLVGDATRIAEIGGATGSFAHEAAADPDRTIVCTGLDRGAIDWARMHRRRLNIAYLDRPIAVEDGPFDLAVAVAVIEHVEDFRGFLRTCIALAPRLLVTAPNRARSPDTDAIGERHVREWTAGEFYWVLRCFYSRVDLYALPDPHVPQLVSVDVKTSRSPLIAACDGPHR